MSSHLTIGQLNTTSLVLGEVMWERSRQNNKWGEQNHPDHHSRVAQMVRNGEPSAAVLYGLPSEEDAKVQCRLDFGSHNPNWATILIEEVSEALDAKGGAKLREELVQVAAVAVAWIECIDRRACGATA